MYHSKDFTINFSLNINPTERDYIFAFKEDKLLIKKESPSIPLFYELKENNVKFLKSLYFGTFNNSKCFVAILDDREKKPALMLFKRLRKLLYEKILNPDFFYLASYALQLLNWDKEHKYCSRCAAALEYSGSERAKKCVQCRKEFYPPVSPAIIVAVSGKNENGEKEILLARNKRFQAGFFSLIAGFVDIGESLEDCLIREVKEEVNIEIENIKYFDSQAWPFPHSLMIGFTADYKSGQVKSDNKEIAEAAWFKADNLPDIPPEGTLSRKLINYFIQNK